MTSQRSFEFTGREYFFQGHFPGFPILPGVMQLAFAEKAVREDFGVTAPLKAVRKMKFTAIIRPGDQVRLELEGASPQISYRWLKGETVCSSGILCF